MKQTQIPPIPPQDKEPDNNNRSPSSLWNLWVDNLKEWHFYLVEEHGHHQRADISGWIDKLRQRIRSFMTSLRRDMRHQKNASRHRKFPESDYGIAQFCLYVAGSIPRVTSAIHERLTLRRRKHIDAAHAFQKQVDKVKTHPVAFLSGALVVVAVCALLSLYHRHHRRL